MRRYAPVLSAALLAAAALLPQQAEGQERAPKPAFVGTAADPPSANECEPGKYGGTLSWCELGELSTFNPIVSADATADELRPLIFDTLVDYDNGRFETEAGLAHSWEHSPDGLVWTFRLRKGVRFSDGEPLTADDVVFSFRTVFHPKIENSNKDGFRVGDAPLPDVLKVDDHTVEFRCKAVNALMLVAVGNVAIVPERLWRDTVQGESPTFPQKMLATDDPKTVVGSGPFRLVRHAPGEAIVYERNPHSWRTDKAGNRIPWLDRLVVLLAKDQNTRTLKFLNGDYDVLNDLPVPDYDQFRAKAKEGWFTLKKGGLSLNTTWVTFNQHPGKDSKGEPFVAPHRLAWFRDVRFRRAMSHATDREALVKLLLEGKGEPVYSHTNQGNLTWHTETPRYELDPAKANAILDEMGLAARDTDGVRKDASGRRVEFEVMTNVENNLRVKAIDQLKQDWSKVGVSALCRTVNFNELVTQLEDGHRWDAILLGWGSGVPPDPLNGKNIILSEGRLHCWYPQQEKPDQPWEAEVDAIVAQMSGLFEENERIPLWHKVLGIFAQQQQQMFLYSQNGYAVWKSRVKNVRCSILRPMATYNAEELWVEDGK